jgi:hypothetical protein
MFFSTHSIIRFALWARNYLLIRITHVINVNAKFSFLNNATMPEELRVNLVIFII